MRYVLVSLSCAGLLTSLAFSSCAMHEKNDDGGEGGSSGGEGLFGSGGMKPTNVGGGTSASGRALAEECPDLLTTLNPGAPGVCSQSQAAAEFNQINMLIVMDKSGSMTSTPPGYTKTKWAGAVDSLKTALDPEDPLVQYGFLLYPYLTGVESPTCELASGELAVNIPVGPASTTVTEISKFMASVTPVGGTPTAAALSAALDYYTKGSGKSLVGSKYVLLVTDGGPNCNDKISPACGPDACTANMDKISSCGTGVPNCCAAGLKLANDGNPLSLCLDDQAVVTRLRALTAQGIKTFVVGIPGTEAYASYLDTFALEGGVPVTEPTKAHSYYEVTGESGLAEAFKSITTSLVRSCSVPLQAAPQDMDNINLAIDCTPVEQSTGAASNWHYDNLQQAIIIEGPNCDRIQQTGVRRVDVVLGCPPYIPI